MRQPHILQPKARNHHSPSKTPPRALHSRATRAVIGLAHRRQLRIRLGPKPDALASQPTTQKISKSCDLLSSSLGRLRQDKLTAQRAPHGFPPLGLLAVVAERALDALVRRDADTLLPALPRLFAMREERARARVV